MWRARDRLVRSPGATGSAGAPGFVLATPSGPAHSRHTTFNSSPTSGGPASLIPAGQPGYRGLRDTWRRSSRASRQLNRKRHTPTGTRISPLGRKRRAINVIVTAEPPATAPVLIGRHTGESQVQQTPASYLVREAGGGRHSRITAPLAGADNRPSWRFLALLGLIGGGPTLLGTLLGQAYVNDVVYLAFLSLAAGSILYVVIQLLAVAQKLGRKQLLYWGVLTGLLAGIATDLIIVAAGA